MQLLFDVKHQTITRKDKNQVVAVSQNYLALVFAFSPEWNGLDKFLYVKHKSEEYRVELVNDQVKLDIPKDGAMRVSLQGRTPSNETGNPGAVVITAIYQDVIAILNGGFKDAEGRYIRSINISEISVINGVPCYEYGGAWIPLAGTITDVPEENTGKILIGDITKSITEENYSTSDKEKLAALPSGDAFNDLLSDVERIQVVLNDTANALNTEILRNDAQDAAITAIQLENDGQNQKIADIQNINNEQSRYIAGLQSDMHYVQEAQAATEVALNNEALRNDRQDTDISALQTENQKQNDVIEAIEKAAHEHFGNKNNPHDVTAAQIGALTSADIEQGENIVIIRDGSKLTIHSTAMGGVGGGGIIGFAVNMDTGYLEINESAPQETRWNITDDGVLEAIM